MMGRRVNDNLSRFEFRIDTYVQEKRARNKQKCSIYKQAEAARGYKKTHDRTRKKIKGRDS
jgi:hypothetical protein